jgi:hypothetical protein
MQVKNGGISLHGCAKGKNDLFNPIALLTFLQGYLPAGRRGQCHPLVILSHLKHDIRRYIGWYSQ